MSQCLDPPDARVGNLGDHAPRDRLGVRLHTRDVEHRTRGDTGALQALEPLSRGSLLEDLRENAHQ